MRVFLEEAQSQIVLQPAIWTSEKRYRYKYADLTKASSNNAHQPTLQAVRGRTRGLTTALKITEAFSERIALDDQSLFNQVLLTMIVVINWQEAE